MKIKSNNPYEKAVLKSFLTLLIGIISLPVFSATYYSRSNGSWHSQNTWSLAIDGAAAGVIPGVGDDVVIDGNIVTLSAGNITVGSVTIESVGAVWGLTTSKLVVSTGKKLTVAGNVTVTSVNKSVIQELLVTGDNSELEILGNLNFSRTANNMHRYSNGLKMENSSTLTVHGTYNVDNAGSSWSLSQKDIWLENNASFICKSNVNMTQSDIGYHSYLFDDNSSWQIDGNWTINQNSIDFFSLSLYDYSSITVEQNMIVNSSNQGYVRLVTGGHATVGVGALFHVKGDFNFLHPAGGDISIRTQERGELRVDGGFDLNWTGTGLVNSYIEVKVSDYGTMRLKKSMTISMDDQASRISMLLEDFGQLIVGANDGLLAESANINVVNGSSMLTDLDSDSKFIVYGDLNQTFNGDGDMKMRLNNGPNTANGNSLLNVKKDWNLTKTNGNTFEIYLKNNSDVLVEGNLTIHNSGFNIGALFNRIMLTDNSKLEVQDVFSWTSVNPLNIAAMFVGLYQNAIMNTGSEEIEATTITANSSSSILCDLFHNAQWNISGDFNFNCISVTSASYVTLFNSSKLNIGRNLIIDNTSNTANIAFNIIAFSTMTVKNDIDFTKVFRENGGLINVDDLGTMKLGGNLIRNPFPNIFGYIEVEEGTGAVLELNGTSPQIIPTWTPFSLYGNKQYGVLLLNNSSAITPRFTMEGKAIITELTVSVNNSLTIDSAQRLIVSEKIINNGIITVNPAGSIEQTNSGANMNAGNGVYRIVQSGKTSPLIFNIWSSPINSANIASTFTGTNPCDIFVFEGPSQSWSYDYTAGLNTICNGNAVQFQAGSVINGGDGIMDVGRGYYAPGNVNPIRTFAGTINNGDYAVPIVTTVLGNNQNWDNDDWNLVGNPYPSAVNAVSFWSENAINNGRITDGIYYWDDSELAGAGNPVSDYAYWNMAGGVNSGNSLEIPNGKIAVGQGFWVTAIATTDLIFKNSMRAASADQFFKTNNEHKNHNAWISLTSPSNIENNILIGFNPNATDTIDANYDAHKLEGNTHLRFSSVINSEEFVIQSQSMLSIGETRIIPLVAFSDEAGSHIISEYKREDLPANYKVYLRDKDLGITHDLSQSDYVVDLLANQEYLTRFELVIRFELKDTSGNGSKETITGLEELETNGFSIIQQNGFLTIVNQNNEKGAVQVFDMTGKLLFQNNLGNGHVTLSSWSNLPSGSYVIYISNNGESLFRKNEIKM